MAPCARRRVISSSNSGHECEERDQLRKAVEIDGPIEYLHPYPGPRSKRSLMLKSPFGGHWFTTLDWWWDQPNGMAGTLKG